MAILKTPRLDRLWKFFWELIQ